MIENAGKQEQPLTSVPNEEVEEALDQTHTEEIAVPTENARFIAIGAYALLIVFGIATGYALSRYAGKTTVATNQKPGFVNDGKVAGITDTRTFKDSAIGTIQKGGLNGEGTHNLVRDGGPSQTVYLISSAVDLDLYIGKKVKVWGQTMAARKVAWLMDVGKIELQ